PPAGHQVEPIQAADDAHEVDAVATRRLDTVVEAPQGVELGERAILIAVVGAVEHRGRREEDVLVEAAWRARPRVGHLRQPGKGFFITPTVARCNGAWHGSALHAYSAAPIAAPRTTEYVVAGFRLRGVKRHTARSRRWTLCNLR